MKAIYKRELFSYFSGLTGYLFIAFLLVVTGIYTVMLNFTQRNAGFEYVISNIGFIFMIIIPILTMRTFAEERAQRTDQLLYSLPLNMWSIVLGKYLAMVTVFLIPVLIMCFYPVMLSFYGTVALKSALGAISGFFFMGAALLAVGMFMSSLTENQIVSAVLCFGAVLLNFLMTMAADSFSGASVSSFRAFSVLIAALGIVIYFMTKSIIASLVAVLLLEIPLIAIYKLNMVLLAGAFQKLMKSLSLFSRMTNFVNGMLDLTTIVYYLSIAAVFVFFSVQSLEKRRWS